MKEPVWIHAIVWPFDWNLGLDTEHVDEDKPGQVQEAGGSNIGKRNSVVSQEKYQ
jgi:hypothetical protein